MPVNEFEYFFGVPIINEEDFTSNCFSQEGKKYKARNVLTCGVNILWLTSQKDYRHI